MGRLSAIIFAILLAILGIFIPLVAVLYFSRSLAVKEEYQALLTTAHRAIERANLTFNRASQVLKYLDKQTFKPCSEEHLQFMRKLTFNIPSIKEIGYFNKGLMKCSTWGMTKEKIIEHSAQFTMPNGVAIYTVRKPLVTQGNTMIGLSYHAYNVLIEPIRFVDVIVNADTKIAILTSEGRVIGLLNNPDLNLINSNLNNYMNDQYIVVILRDSGWIAVVSEPRRNLDIKSRHDRLLLWPIGLIIAIFMEGLVIWLLRRRLSFLGELTIAVEKHEFIVFYQPIVDLESGQCVGAEALVRWRRPNGDLIQPDLFIPLAEQSGLISPITDQVVETVITEMSEMLTADRTMHIAINLSVEDIKTGRILPVIEAHLAKTLIHRSQIWLEITERGFMNLLSAQETIKKARALGYIVAIDDFGTGYSSLSSLQTFSLNILKIDKSFVYMIDTDAMMGSVTPHIINMAHTLKLEIVAEGIENKAQIQYLLEHNVKYGQGWFFSKALSPQEFIAFYKQNRNLA